MGSKTAFLTLIRLNLEGRSASMINDSHKNIVGKKHKNALFDTT